MMEENWIGFSAPYHISSLCEHGKIYDSVLLRRKQRSKSIGMFCWGFLVVGQLFSMMPVHFSVPEVNDFSLMALQRLPGRCGVAHVSREENESLLESVACGQRKSIGNEYKQYHTAKAC